MLPLVGLLGLALVPGPRATNASGPGPGYDLSPVTTLVQNAVTTTPLPGASLLLFKDGQVIYEQYFGGYSANTAVYIASATKWVSATVFMTLVDEGVVSLDDPVSMHLPAWTGQIGTITMRQLWSHTSGLPGDHACLGDLGITLDACVEQIRLGGLIAAPGSQFYYGGASMQVAGRVAEVAAGKPWSQLFQERIKTPLGLTTATYGLTNNPRIGGGVLANLDDYSRLLQMHHRLGSFNGQQVVSAGAVIEMQKDQTFGVPLAYTPHLDTRRYGLGVWRDLVDGQGAAEQLSSQGAFGFSPWLDMERGYFGVFLVQTQLANVYFLVSQIQVLVRGILDSYDTDIDGQADSADTDDDSDGYSDSAEYGMPLCGNGVNDDPGDDALVDDGCPTGPAVAGAYAEGAMRIGTWSGDACGTNAWPSDLVSGTPDSADKITLTDLTNFLAPLRRLDTSPGDAAFDARWDLVTGAGPFPKLVNLVDLTALLAGPTGYPPMFGGVRAFSGPACTP
jgi:CubicO group peptidase (beta-lactamase class C family)